RNLAQAIQRDLRVDAYTHLQDLELAYFEERSTGRLMAVLNDDINQLERFLDVGANEVLQVITTVILIGGAFWVMAPAVAWMAILPMPFIIWGAIAFQRFLAPRYAEVRERVSVLNSRLANNLSGILTIKSFAAESFEIDRVREESEAYRLSNRRAIAFSAAFIPLIRILILFGFTATLLYGGLLAVEGQLAVGTYSVLVFLTQRLLWPLTRLGETLDQYQRAVASTHRVMELLDTPITLQPGQRRLPVSNVRGDIRFEDVTFSYHPQAPITQHLTLKVPAGQTVAIVGSTGSGKSTLVKLLLRFYEVAAGRITLDDIDIRELAPQDLRQAVGLVSQDVFLFHGTVAENIAYGTFGADPAAIEEAARIAEAHDFIAQLPNGYDTIVGERGQKLSGGQRQRLAIARAVLKNPPVLVLDEATSAVDNETEAAIQRSLEKITQNRTTIAIAHRLSTIRNADRIYVMEYGQLVEWGTHEELLERQGIYAGLWNVQMGLRGKE
ncbi:MAG: ABC transporter ATP-binding protein, partial [Leptolyngbya sp. SIO1D8]|nr:ABC transporter ATP-binding protein [Leptolyngbya sp. SIO1D8]